MKVIGQVGDLQSTRNGWSQTLGDYVEQIFHGTSDYARSVYLQIRANGINGTNQCADCELEINEPTGTVRARFASSLEPGGEEQLQVEIRLGRNDVQKSIFEAGPDGYISGLTTSEIRNIQALIDDPLDDVAFTWLADNGSDAALAIYELAKNGLQYRIVYQPILTHITTASAQFQWPNKNQYSHDILSESTMLSLFRSAPNFVIPDAAGLTVPSGYVYGWKMAPPTYETSSDGHSSEVLEFEFGLWPVQITGNVV